MDGWLRSEPTDLATSGGKSRRDLTKTKGVLGQLSDIKASFDPSFVGPLDERASRAAQVFGGLSEKEDVTDWINGLREQGINDDAIRARLLGLVDESRE